MCGCCYTAQACRRQPGVSRLGVTSMWRHDLLRVPALVMLLLGVQLKAGGQVFGGGEIVVSSGCGGCYDFLRTCRCQPQGPAGCVMEISEPQLIHPGLLVPMCEPGLCDACMKRCECFADDFGMECDTRFAITVTLTVNFSISASFGINWEDIEVIVEATAGRSRSQIVTVELRCGPPSVPVCWFAVYEACLDLRRGKIVQYELRYVASGVWQPGRRDFVCDRVGQPCHQECRRETLTVRFDVIEGTRCELYAFEPCEEGVGSDLGRTSEDPDAMAHSRGARQAP